MVWVKVGGDWVSFLTHLITMDWYVKVFVFSCNTKIIHSVSLNHNSFSLLLFHTHECTQHDNPKIQVVLNDGVRLYEHHSDGIRQESGSCLKEFRNRPYPFKMKISYLRGVLEVSLLFKVC